MRELRDALRGITNPIILAGDFNSAPWVPFFSNILDHNKLRVGPDIPGTWPVWAGPLAIPLDNIAAQAPAEVLSVRLIEDSAGSNHRGIVAEIAIP